MTTRNILQITKYDYWMTTRNILQIQRGSEEVGSVMQPDLLNSRRDGHRGAALHVKSLCANVNTKHLLRERLLSLGYILTDCGERSREVASAK